MSIPKIKKLIIKNFGCIGNEPVSIDIDKIVILVGANNAGKSTILRAYEAVTDNLKLDLSDFHNNQVDVNSLPTIELHSIFTSETKPGDEWCLQIENTNNFLVREKWVWESPNKEPSRVGFNIELNRYAEDGDKEKQPWGMQNKAKSKRPKPHRVSTFDSPEVQALAIKSLLKSILDDQIREFKLEEEEKPSYQIILDSLIELRNQIKQGQESEIEKLELSANEIIGKIFPNHNLKIISPPSDKEVKIDLLGDEFEIKMGHINGETFPLEKQGSGSRRTALWTILKLLADKGYKAKITTSKAANQHESLGNIFPIFYYWMNLRLAYIQQR